MGNGTGQPVSGVNDPDPLMLIFGLPYIGLVSFIIALTNLIPTFGPLFGGAVGAFILMLDRPLYAIIFLAITAVLQIIDAYLLKPKLFGNSLGVSGLWILIGIIVGGRMFGVLGMFLAVPACAIIYSAFSEIVNERIKKRQELADIKQVVYGNTTTIHQ